jgi:SUN domain-containing protein 1/2
LLSTLQQKQYSAKDAEASWAAQSAALAALENKLTATRDAFNQLFGEVAMALQTSYAQTPLAESGFALPDYSGKFMGAEIVATSASAGTDQSLAGRLLDGFGFGASSHHREQLITSDSKPGQCWPLNGSMGWAVIKLAEPIRITSWSYSHSFYEALRHGPTPKSFQLRGMSSSQCQLPEEALNLDANSVLLSNSVFDPTAETSGNRFMPKSTAMFTVEPVLTQKFSCVLLRVLSNYGQASYTCVYRVRIHGSA